MVAGYLGPLGLSMYRFDHKLDLNSIVGAEVEQICCGRFDVQFRGSRFSISVQSRLTLKEGDEVIGIWTPEDNWSSIAFQRLLKTPIMGFSVLTDRLLEIRFACGVVAHFHDDSEQYESLQIYLPGDKVAPIVV